MVTRTLSNQSAPATCITSKPAGCKEQAESGNRRAGRAGHPRYRIRSVTPTRAGHPHYRKSNEAAVHPRLRSATPRPSAGHPHFRAAVHPRLRSASPLQVPGHPRCRKNGRSSARSRNPIPNPITVSAGHPHYRAIGKFGNADQSCEGRRHGRRGGRGRRPVAVHPRLRNISSPQLPSVSSSEDHSQDEGRCGKGGGRGTRCGRTAVATIAGQGERQLRARLTGPHAHRVHAHAFPHAPRGERKSSPGRRGRGGWVQNPMATDRVIRTGRPSSRGGRGGRGRDGGSRRQHSPTPNTPARHGKVGGRGRRGMRKGGRGRSLV